MTALFTLPGQTPLNIGAVVPGAKLYFYQTGTSTPQNTYTTEALSVASSNPVVADANGVFEAIYLDPTLPSYRATLTTSADVLIKQWDGVPSNQNVQQSTRLESTNPFVFWYDTDGTANLRKYRARAATNSWEVQLANDAENSFTTILQYNASTGILYSNATEVAVTVAGTFTGTLTGCTTSPTATYSYRKVNNIVTLWTDANLTATSNTDAMTLTGLPAAIRPSSDKGVTCTNLQDNSIAVIGTASVGTGGSIIFGVNTVSGTKVIPGAFVNSGAKGILTGWCITYSLS